MTYRTRLHVGSIESTLSRAIRALFVTLDGDFLGHALRYFFQCEAHARTYVTPAHHSLLITLATAETSETGKSAEATETAAVSSAEIES